MVHRDRLSKALPEGLRRGKQRDISKVSGLANNVTWRYPGKVVVWWGGGMGMAVLFAAVRLSIVSAQ